MTEWHHIKSCIISLITHFGKGKKKHDIPRIFLLCVHRGNDLCNFATGVDGV